MIPAMLVSTFLVFATVLIHYETLRGLSNWLPRLRIAPRQRILVVICAVFLAHTAEVWLHALAFYFSAGSMGIGTFGGQFTHGFHDCLYFSTVTYTSLGLGDIYPLGGLRLVSGVEALTGLLMIGWSASFTYLTMEKFWVLHGRRDVVPGAAEASKPEGTPQGVTTPEPRA